MTNFLTPPTRIPFDTEPQTSDTVPLGEIDLNLRPAQYCYFGSVIQEYPYAYNYSLSAQGLIPTTEHDILDLDSFRHLPWFPSYPS